MPSIHSSVSTRRAVRLQSIAGTKKPGSASIASASSEARGRLAPQVELARGPALERRDDQPRAQPRRFAAQRFDLRRGPFIGVDRAGELLLDAGAQHLDRDGRGLRSSPRDGPARSTRRRPAPRRSTANSVVDRRARAPASIAARIVAKGDRRQRVLQPHQIVRGVFADQIGPRRQRLAELDRGRADRLEAHRHSGHLGHARAEPRERSSRRTGGRRDRVALDPAQRAVPREDPAPFQQPPEMGRLRVVKSSSRCGSRRARRASARRLVWTKPASPIIASKSGMSGKRRIDSTR